jgi:hypothetical protein
MTSRSMFHPHFNVVCLFGITTTSSSSPPVSLPPLIAAWKESSFCPPLIVHLTVSTLMGYILFRARAKGNFCYSISRWCSGLFQGKGDQEHFVLLVTIGACLFAAFSSLIAMQCCAFSVNTQLIERLISLLLGTFVFC